MSSRKTLKAIFGFVVAFLISGCGTVPAFVAGGSVLGVEYTLSNKARKVFPVKKEKIRHSVTNVLDSLKFRVLQNWRDRSGTYVIKAASNRYYIVISLQDVSLNATRKTVDTKHKSYFFLKDKAFATSIIVELDKKFKKS